MGKVIVFAGTRGAGKTAAIRTVSDTVSHLAGPCAPLAPDPQQFPPDPLDHGTARLADGGHVHLYGAPGWGWPDFVYALLAEMAHGLVVLVDSRSHDPLADLEEWLVRFRPLLAAGRGAVAIGLTHGDARSPAHLRDRLYSRLDNLNAAHCIPIFEMDGRKRSDIEQLLLAVSAMIDQHAATRAVSQICSSALRQTGGSAM